MALRRLREILVGKEDAALIDLQEIQDHHFKSKDSVPMAMTSPVFPADTLMEQLLFNLRSQSVMLKTSTLTALCNFHEEQTGNDGYVHPEGNGWKSQIGLQVLFLHSKMSADELYQRITEIPIANGNVAQKRHRDRLLEVRLLAVLAQLKYEPFSFTLESGEYEQRVRSWLLSKTATTVISTVINNVIEPIELVKVSPESVKVVLEGMKIYKCQALGGYLKGCALRDGMLICTSQLVHGKGKYKYWADVYSLSLHDATHYCARANYDNYLFSSPSSYVRPEGAIRRDPNVEHKKLELGRAAEMLIFGGHPGGMQVNWALSEESAAKNFVNRVQKGDPLPWYNTKTVCVQSGMVEREQVSLSFAGEMVDQVPEEL